MGRKRKGKNRRRPPGNARQRQQKPQRPAANNAQQKRSVVMAEEGVVRHEAMQVEYSGPLPPPNLLAQYEEITPGLVDRIVTMTERQSEHRQRMELAFFRGDQRRSWVGLFLGFLVALAGLAVTAYLGAEGNPWVAGIVGAIDLTSLVALFVYGQFLRKERSGNVDTSI